MNASNNYRNGALMENLEGRTFFSATGGERQPPVPPVDVAYSDTQLDHTATLPRHQAIDTTPVRDGPVSDGSTAQG